MLWNALQQTWRLHKSPCKGVFLQRNFGFSPQIAKLPSAMARVVLALLALATAETVNDCIESKCRGCGGEQCQLCREDQKIISSCVSSCLGNSQPYADSPKESNIWSQGPVSRQGAWTPCAVDVAVSNANCAARTCLWKTGFRNSFDDFVEQ